MMDRTSVTSQHHGGAGSTRVHAYPCAMGRVSWSFAGIGMNTALKPWLRRFSRIS
jgi:hypothetical protein